MSAIIKPRKIILVEDSPDDADLTVMSLREAGLLNEVVVLEDGAQAVEYLFCKGRHANRDAAEIPALVLLDIKLPLLNGIEVLRQMRANSQTKLLPVVVLTTSKEDIDLVRAYENGANAYVRKPVNFLDFGEAVRKLGMFWLLLNEPPPPKDAPK